MKNTIRLMAVLGATAAGSVRADFTLVKDGAPAATLVVREGDRPARFAAGQFAYWTREVTGARLPVVTLGESSAAVKGPAVYIGKAFAEAPFADDVAYLGASEGFAVREKGGDLYVFGGGAGVGALFGCYDLLEKNTDLIWPCLDAACDRVFTPVKSLVLKTGYREKPAVAKRLVMHDRSTRAQYFFLRNRAYTNWAYHPFRTMGIVDDDFACHNIGICFRDDGIRAAHPEWFGVYRGKKMMNPGGFDGNICYSQMASADFYADKFIAERLATTVRNGPYGIGAEDNNMLCECADCLKPIRLPDGRTLKIEDDETLFRSTQFYLWINRVAERVKAKRPDVRLETIAYMYGQRPPAVKLCDNITVQYAPIGKNMKRDYFAKGNEKQKQWLVEWSERCSELAFFEYWGDGAGFPRPISSVLAVDIPFMLDHKTTYVNSEWGQESDRNRSKYVSALEFWVTYRLMWNPKQDLETLRETFFRRAFREGAREMRVFYDTLREAWYKDASTSFYYDNPTRLTGYYFLGDDALRATCFGALTNAARAVRHPAAKVLVGKIKESMEGYLAAAAKTFVKGGSAVIPYVNDASLATLEGGAWSQALVIDDSSGLKSMLKLKLKKNVPASFEMAHDGKNLYVRFRTEWSPAVFRKGSKSMWSNEHMEVFIQPDKNDPAVSYYQFGVDPYGKQATNIGYNKCENPPRWTVMTQRTDERWSAVCVFPFSEIGIKKGVPPRIFFMHHAQVEPSKGEWKSWNGYGVHDAASFTECKLGE